jgi:nucleotide-binding universal stress UspA family protein
VSGAKNELETLTEAFASYGCVKGPHIVCTGKPYQKILETAKDKGADIIVLGSHGYTGIRRVYIGSTAERVVRHAPCHVLVVRE